MEDGQFVDVRESCAECGLKRAVVRAGFLYCAECGMRAAESQPLMEFTQDNFTGIKMKSRKLTKGKSEKEKLSNMWSTWHAHNMILVGLVEEACSCGAKETLVSVVLRVWARWLRHNRVAFFSKVQKTPKMTLGFNARDLRLLYNMKKKRKRTPKIQVDGDTGFGRKMQTTQNTAALVKQHHEEFLNTQTSTQPLASQTLENVKIQEDDTPKTIEFNRSARKHFNKIMTPEQFELHTKRGFCGSSCKCFNKVASNVRNRKNVSSIFNLYVILFLGLRINNDELQLGDILRWCREGVLTFGIYNHFFPEDMHFDPADRFRLSPTMLSHSAILKTASRFANVLKLNGIKSPDIHLLVKRYIQELELPHELYGLISKIMSFTKRIQDYYPAESRELPNYEAIALSYIVVSLKMFFGLDGVTENQISSTAKNVNKILDLDKDKKQLSAFSNNNHDDDGLKFRRLFVWSDWTKYVEYRKVCLRQCHYPTRMRLDPDDTGKPQLFLHHKNKTRKMQPDGVVKNNSNSIIKSLLQRIEDNGDVTEKEFPNFSCSLTPTSSYIEELLNWRYLNTAYSDVNVNREILEENFSQYNVSYLIHPKPLQNILKTKDYHLYIHHFNANPDLVVDKDLKEYLKYNKRETNCLQISKMVEVFDCGHSEWESDIRGEKITQFVSTAGFKDDKLKNHIVTVKDLKSTRCPSGESKQFENKRKKMKTHRDSLDLHACYGNYWIRHYPNFVKKFTPDSFENELDVNFAPCFGWLLRECAAIAEVTSFDLYKELCAVEKQIIEMINGKEKASTEKGEED